LVNAFVEVDELIREKGDEDDVHCKNAKGKKKPFTDGVNVPEHAAKLNRLLLV
jgi:hypothetical protein